MDDRLELARLERVKWSEAHGRACLLEEMRKVIKAELFNHFEGAATAREMQAYAHHKYREHIVEMTKARTEANILWAGVLKQEREFERWRTKESTKRAEMQLR